MRFLIIVILFAISNTSISYAQEALARVKEGKLYGYINTDGEYAIAPKFKFSRDFSEGFASVEEDNKFGFVDTTGKWVIEPIYENVKDFNSGLALVNDDGNWKYVDTTGKDVSFPEADKYYTFNNGVAFYKKDGKVGLFNSKGGIILEPTFDVIKKFIDGHAIVVRNDLWGMINAKGEMVIPTEYRKIGDYNKNGIWGRKGDTFGVFNNFKFNPISGVEKIWDFYKDSKVTYAKKDDLIGYVNNSGEWVVPPKFEKGRAFHKGLAPVYMNKKWGYINKKGEIVIDYQFRDAEVFSDNGLAPVKVKDWGFIDMKGSFVIPPKYAITTGFGIGQKFSEKGFIGKYVRVKYKGDWGFLNKDGELLNNTWYKNAELFRK